ncbi:HU family DNA-binding protein [Prevotella corporis]|jgi:predicted histone-like DNA-binding protein|uniref:HU family DNA-binding protein n=1 Tax=Prevotella corporis TaxID=28128 RepID=UPI0023F09BC4|nr:HU family DNA-binding protein [Prevotella corporis]
MAIKYRMYQDKRKKSKTKGNWYARAVMKGTVGVKELSERISERCTVTESDIVAVLCALVKEMAYDLKNGHRVKLDGFGSFKVGIRSRGVSNSKDFSVAKNIYDPHIIFRPDSHKGADKHYIKTFLEGVKMEEDDKYAGAGDDGKTGGTGSNDPANP